MKRKRANEKVGWRCVVSNPGKGGPKLGTWIGKKWHGCSKWGYRGLGEFRKGAHVKQRKRVDQADEREDRRSPGGGGNGTLTWGM